MKKAFLYLLFAVAGIGQVTAQANFTKTAKGALYSILKAGGGAKIKEGEVITFHFIQKNDRDSVLGSSYQMGKPAQVQVQPSRSVADLMEVFSILSVNDSALVRVPTDSVFVGHEESRPPFLPKGSYLNFTIKILKVQTLEQAMAERTAAMEKERTEKAAAAEKMRGAETSTIAKYIADNRLAPLSTASGLKYVITTPSTGRKPLAGDTLLVNYAGRTMDGKLFDSSIEEVAKAGGLQQPGRTYEPIKVVVGNSEVIRGWDEGLLLVNEGSKAKFIIPSALAYGERGAGEDIKPYSPLVFDIELVKVIPGVHKKAVTKKAASRKPAAKKGSVKKVTTKKKVTSK
ncbi:FKBP-type peptidyl-prolyl cis-trans isomerase [Mucilaginibacter terrae]|uniref:peptidylprolyl isomerase n=1 Tax=Mucilaginibacter terrae TaxID=1955052 RepID=A0ABU3GX94_9SPHI|nr:FKBP-type peptidyl-prolyl cis-trans isomerase [Mucilaginibacter terrae]MDT3404387.1 FKBP-type peptidyl-prolyl cis-trans isomerase FkpA [Mucilaginibacter terrae]